MRWWWYELKRLWRLHVQTEPSASRLIKCVGAFWLWRHGAKREYKVKLWKTSPGWYAIDIAIPDKDRNGGLGIEADGWVHDKTKSRDYIRDHRLAEKGWEILRINDREVRSAPRAVRRRVRKFLKG